MDEPLSDEPVFAPNIPQTAEDIVAEAESLMNMPQSLCKQTGQCCRVATFKGSLTLDELKVLGEGDSQDAEHARAFSSVFLPYESQDAVREVANEFVDRVREQSAEKGEEPDSIAFFYCRYLQDDNRCAVHEDRPVGCRAYPFPHRLTLFHPGCGFEKQGKQNWARMVEIMQALGMDSDKV